MALLATTPMGIWLTNGLLINVGCLITLTSSTLMTLNGHHYGLFFYSKERVLMNPLLTGRRGEKAIQNHILKLNFLWSEQARLSVLLCVFNTATINILKGASPVTYLETAMLIFFSW